MLYLYESNDKLVTKSIAVGALCFGTAATTTRLFRVQLIRLADSKLFSFVDQVHFQIVKAAPKASYRTSLFIPPASNVLPPAEIIKMSPPLPKPTLAQRLQGFIAPFLMILVVIRNGFLPALRAQISSPSVRSLLTFRRFSHMNGISFQIKLLSIPAWWDHILSNGFGAILAQSDADSHVCAILGRDVLEIDVLAQIGVQDQVDQSCSWECVGDWAW